MVKFTEAENTEKENTEVVKENTFTSMSNTQVQKLLRFSVNENIRHTERDTNRTYITQGIITKCC